MKESSWLNKPREGFTKDRQDYFAKAAPVNANGRQTKRSYPSTKDAVELQSTGPKSAGYGTNTFISQRGLQKRARLVE